MNRLVPSFLSVDIVYELSEYSDTATSLIPSQLVTLYLIDPVCQEEYCVRSLNRLDLVTRGIDKLLRK